MIIPNEHEIKQIPTDLFIVGELQLGGFVWKHKFENNVSVLPSANFKQTGKSKHTKRQ